MNTEDESLKNHLKKVHGFSPLSNKVFNILYGGSDGIVTTLAVISGFAGSQNSSLGLGVGAVILFGLANLFGDGVSMGLGNYLGSLSERRFIQKQNQIQICEIENYQDYLKTHTIQSYIEAGFNKKEAKTLTNIIANNPQYWLKVLAQSELGLDLNKLEENIWQGSLITFLSFIFFGFIPLLAFLLPFNLNIQLWISYIGSFLAMIMLGSLRFVLTKEKYTRAVLETLGIATIASLIAFLVGYFISF